MEQLYVYNGMTVKLTGRKAKRESSSSTRRTSRIKKDDELFEIANALPTDMAMTKWVRMNELYIITTEDTNDKDSSLP